MEEIRIQIPDELKFLKKVPNIRWSVLASKLIRERLEEIARIEKIVAKSKLTEKDVEKFTEKINTSLSERYLKK